MVAKKSHVNKIKSSVSHFAEEKSREDVAACRSQLDPEVFGQLWTIACKLRGLGELIKFRSGEPPIEEDEVNYGLGEILTDLAGELGEIKEMLGENRAED